MIYADADCCCAVVHRPSLKNRNRKYWPRMDFLFSYMRKGVFHSNLSITAPELPIFAKFLVKVLFLMKVLF